MKVSAAGDKFCAEPVDGPKPPFGPGLAPAGGVIGRIRDRLLHPLTFRRLTKIALPAVNRMRDAAGGDPRADDLIEGLIEGPRGAECRRPALLPWIDSGRLAGG